jgi:hypothetical protein
MTVSGESIAALQEMLETDDAESSWSVVPFDVQGLCLAYGLVGDSASGTRSEWANVGSELGLMK